MNDISEARNCRVLVIDDNQTIHGDFRKIFASEGRTHSAMEESEALLFGAPVKAEAPLQFSLDSAYQGKEGAAMVKQALEEGRPYAMAFVDVRMPPGWDGIETTQRLWEMAPDLQIVICTAYSDYSWHEMFDRIGKSDGLLLLKKPFDAAEALQLAHALTEKWRLHQQSRRKMEELESRVAQRTSELRKTNDALEVKVTEHARAEEELRGKKAFLEAQVHSSLDGILVVNHAGTTILQNRRFVELFKMTPHIAGKKDEPCRLEWTIDKIKSPEEFLKTVAHLNSHPEEISHHEIELVDGTILDRYSSPVIGQDGKNYGRIWRFLDITERKRLEAQLIQSQKMETVGKLAGGVAHEFNSILTAIIGQSELLLGDLPEGGAEAKSVQEISRAAGRAATLTHQLLAFARKQFLHPEVLDLNRVLAGMQGVFHLVMGSGVETRIVPCPKLSTVKADAGQIEEVIVCMVINARDAMPQGGRLTLETANVSFNDEEAGRYPELKPGNYVMLAISDSGTGMNQEVKARLFEPFFTTKGVGQGTGLSLSTCYGIIKQSRGHISVDSETGHGTTFKIYLPQMA